MLAVAAAAQFVAGCSGQPADLHGLPEDAAERATLCGRAALAFAGAAEQLGLPAQEVERRGALVQSVVDATDFFGATNTDDAKGKEILADIEGTLTGGEWLDTLNRCKAAYELGPAEAVPALPADPAAKAAACGAASLLAGLKGRKIDDVKNMVEDPQAAYFLTLLASERGGDMAGAQAGLEAQVLEVTTGGAAVSLKAQCLKDYPKAASGTAVTLPAEEDRAAMVCAYATGLMKEGAGDAAKRAEAMEKRLDQKALMVVNSRASKLQAELLGDVVKLGTPPDIMTACEKQFGA